MPSSLQIFTVTITNGNANTTPKDGFVDPTKIEKYETSLATTPPGLTYVLCQAKRRGNIRYREIIHQLGLVANCYIMENTIVTNATDKTEGTSIKFKLWVDQVAYMITADELTPGVKLTGASAVKRCVARALIADLFKQIDVVDPTSTTSVGGKGATVSVPRYGARIAPASAFEVGPYATSITQAETMVTVV